MSQCASEISGYVQAWSGAPAVSALPWVAPAWCCGWRKSANFSAWDSDLGADGVGSRLPQPAFVTSHDYPLTACSPAWAVHVTIPNLLSATTMNNDVAAVQGAESALKAQGLVLRMAEINSVSCSGLTGTSDTVAAALWGLDEIFRYAKAGVIGVNFHGGGGSPYSPVLTSPSLQAQPLYYSLVLFGVAAGEAFLPLPLTLSSAANVTAYAVGCAGCQPKVFLINKDLSAGGQVYLRPSQPMASAQVLTLAGSSLSSTVATLGGVTVNNATGILPRPATTLLLPDASGGFLVSLPNACAALVTLDLAISLAPSPTASLSQTPSPGASATATPSASSPATPSPTRSATVTATPPTATFTATPMGTVKATATVTATARGSAVGTMTPSPSPVETATILATASPTCSASSTSTATATSPSDSVTGSATRTSAATPRPLGTGTPPPTATATASPNATMMPSPGSSPQPGPGGSVTVVGPYPNPWTGRGPLTLRITCGEGGELGVRVYTAALCKVLDLRANAVGPALAWNRFPQADGWADGLYYWVVEMPDGRRILKRWVLAR